MRWLALVGLGLSIVGARAASLMSAHARAREQARALPSERRDGGYVGAGACRSCHPVEHATWHGSFHRTMTQAVTPETVLADFSGRPDLERRGDEYWVRMADPAAMLAGAESPGATGWQRAVMSTGSHHMQLFWVRDRTSGKLVAFPSTYLLDDRRWVPNESTLLRPDDGGVAYTWNAVCVMCHAVAGQPGLDDSPVDTRVVDLGIGCESCHGPGADHIANYRNPMARYRDRGREGDSSTIVDPSALSPREASAICGQCHSVWLPIDEASWRRDGLSHRPGADFSSSARIARHPTRADQAWIDEVLAEDGEFLAGRFWSDGMVRVVGREYNGLIESPCAVSEEFGCSSCHSMHDYLDPADQLGPAGRDGSACGSCHEDIAAGVAEHTHHDRESSRAPSCEDCHMPHTSYGLLGAVRSHQVDSPNVDVSRETGRPNACNLCHLDRSLRWTAGWLAQWYGHSTVESDSDPSGEPEVAAAVADLLRGDAGQRALAAWHMGWGPALDVSGSGWQAELLAMLAADPYPAVRLVAERALRRLRAHPPVPVGERSSADQALLLRSPDGRFDSGAAARWLQQRDDRFIDLRE